jgi:alpha-L-arabinofuranosidase
LIIYYKNLTLVKKTVKRLEMKNIIKVFISGLILNVWFNMVSAQTINVDVGIVIKSFDHNPVSINIDYLMDDDSFLKPEIGIKESLLNMNIGAIRYPGGEKADNYLWSVPPYTSANPQFATKGNCNWPNNDSRFSSNYINPLSTTMDFDEFMTLCDSINSKPFIVVAGDANYCTFCPNPPTLDELITNAVEWVKYANIKKNFKIKYWMVGNESWNSAAYDNPSTALQYANDFIQFYKAMKAVDSSIVIVANTKPGSWLNTLLTKADGYLDAVAISNYPIWNWTNGYDTYRNSNPNFVSDINSVATAIGSKRIGIIVSEYNSIDWSDAWPHNNDLGHALVNFQMFGDQIKHNKVIDAYHWNTRWVNNASTPQHLNDAIDASGNLNATGKALAMWGRNLLDKLVFSTNSGYINSFASIDSSGNDLNIFLINKDYSSHSVTVNIANYPSITHSNLNLTLSEFTGASITDKFPLITAPVSNALLSNSSINIELNPLSITVIKMKSDYVSKIVNFNSNSNSILIYPTYVCNILNIQFDDFVSKPELKIFSSFGKEIHSEIITNYKTEIDLSKLSSGTYIISIGSYKSKIIKL